MENTSINIEDTDKEHMKTMASCLNSLARVGYEAQFKIVKNGLKSLKTERTYSPEDIKITNFYRFEGESVSWISFRCWLSQVFGCFSNTADHLTTSVKP